MRVRLVAAAAGLALLALPGEARPAAHAASARTPAPTVAVSMAAPTGTQPSPVLNAAWYVTRPGIQGALVVQGKTAAGDPGGALSDVALPVPFPTTITATWTSNLITAWSHDLTGHVVLSWNDGMPPASGASRLTVRVRFCDANGRWGRWTNLYDKPFTDSTAAFFTTSGPVEVFDPIKFPGRVPAKKIRVQLALTDLVPQGGILEQAFWIDLDPASHGVL